CRLCFTSFLVLDPGVDQLKPAVSPLDLNKLEPVKCMVGLHAHESSFLFEVAPVDSQPSSKEHSVATGTQTRILDVEYIYYELGSIWRHFAFTLARCCTRAGLGAFYFYVLPHDVPVTRFDMRPCARPAGILPFTLSFNLAMSSCSTLSRASRIHGGSGGSLRRNMTHSSATKTSKPCQRTTASSSGPSAKSP